GLAPRVRAQDTEPVHAEEADGAAQAEARAAFERGVRHAGAGAWEEALEAFRASLARYPRGRTLFNVAVALDRLERGPQCMRAIERLLARDDVGPDDRAEAEALRDRWRDRLGRLVLRVEPPEATVRIDDVSMPGDGARRRYWLAPGAHRLRVGAPGFEASDHELELGAGGERRLEIALERAPLGRSGVQLRPLDRATVRLIAIRGADQVTPPSGTPATVVLRASHGSGVVVRRDGWVLTARHVVEGADQVVALLPGETRAVAARSVWMDEGRDLALVRLAEPVPHALSLETPPALVAGQAVAASGYPLDATERFPAASAGTVGRPLNDGRVQLSIALNPGNSGGPVMADERLIGVVSQGGDPGRGVQGVVVMEPLAPVVDALVARLESGAPAPRPDPTDAVAVELLGASAPPPVVRRLARLRQAAADPPSDVRAAIWAIEAEDARRTILADASVALPIGLPADQRALYDELSELAARLSRGAVAEPSLAARYGALSALSAPIEIDGWGCERDGACGASADEPSEPGRGWLFDLTLAGGLAIDDHPNAQFVEGAVGSVLGLFHLGNWGDLDPIRVNVVLGAEASIGSWREELVLTALGDLGVRVALGSPDVAIAVQLLYTPGLVVAETRADLAYLGYRASVAVQLYRFGIGTSWREVGRGGEDTHRAWEIFLSWGY
ncbi:MAG TPA: trypsin-like peptidase domain-containing protein, partial [Sandaracinaceae bacterium LLY-WYZ-13_1]|nr:trypsin-like peptidase domain-containing protein [Sandaracinaceae bacterium LLY-WYZ-13_1]